MPQMAPISWLSLFIIFSMTFMIFNMMNYYSYIPLMPKSNFIIKNNLMNSLNWKW
uniref:ATP synthase complex subunit 8 n=1 Tax=Polleniopsis mongolica TaxID=2774354 RepID=A0A7M3V7X0_9MUSC|nr:ATP synthase F0 subunit 8 [Polleniopsis mongolica]QOP39570.1 ATP synthase F0 subunit 8 [Polleniopsis mongolica]QXG15703.1 ATP synthase F0 subunit 8 [Polleniopsis mongolica]